MSEATVHITGNVATDVKYVRYERGARATFRLASTRRRFDRETSRWIDGQSSFVTVECWRTLAEHVASCVHKGDPLVVHGRLRVDEWTREDGSAATVVKVEADRLGHDLSLGTSAFRRVRRDDPQRHPQTEQARRSAGTSWDSSVQEPARAAPANVVASATGPGAPPTHPESGGDGPWTADSAATADAGGQAA